MQTLPPTQRLLVQAAYAPGARIDQLARQSGRTPMALYKTLHRIRISLVDCVRAFLEKEART
jgi:RNA polymerase sigma-70 factor (ECF subfamily)